MVAAIRQTVTVEHDGRIEIRSPELRSGAVAEVIVLVPELANPDPHLVTPLEALDKLQASLKLDSAAVNRWLRDVEEERRAT